MPTRTPSTAAKTATLKSRHAWSPAYVDSTMVVLFILGAAIFSFGIAYATRFTISPLWLGPSIMAIVLYQLAILWLIRQYWEVNRIMFIFTTNVICLGLIFGFFEFIFSVRLPTDMPVLNYILHAYGITVTSLSPGVVALSYATVAILSGGIMLLNAVWIERLPGYEKVKRLLRLDTIDLLIDHRLDSYSFWMDRGEKAWLMTPQVLLVATLVVVLGLAVLI